MSLQSEFAAESSGVNSAADEAERAQPLIVASGACVQRAEQRGFAMQQTLCSLVGVLALPLCQLPRVNAPSSCIDRLHYIGLQPARLIALSTCVCSSSKKAQLLLFSSGLACNIMTWPSVCQTDRLIQQT